MSDANKPLVGIVMGSSSDWDVMQHAVAMLKEFGIAHEAQVISAHRMPDQMFEYAKSARARGLRAIIAGAGGAAHLPGMIASQTIVPVLGVPHEAQVISAHRMPDQMFDYAKSARSRGLRAIIAGAGGAAHLPGMVASQTIVPVLGVPVPSKYLRGEDSLLSIVQMPKGIPVATFAIGEAGAANAALSAIAMIAVDDASIAEKLLKFRQQQTEAAQAMKLPL